MLLETPRLRLRRFQATDALALSLYRSDPAVARYQGWTAPVPLDEAVQLVREFGVGEPDLPGWFQYAVELKEDGALIGDVGVGLHDNLMQADLGYTLASGRQRRGYATEAVRAVLRDLFQRQGLRRVSAVCDARNERSARLLERAGFVLEGERPAFTWAKGEWTDDLLYGLLAARWGAWEAAEAPDG
ncbi:GCN5 family acetyltransferase [Streptomyces sp. 150FB]|uniref:GNAT family N-acetyltransferase n=1 Tax=Streptomyces sp. 150FB TaxID=1576605 RepID=UPI0005896987|nr:GNAT family protein [Streptomyces sp. 150FB]KIF76079.1 GCN5 family acetyltransferase [Streptomyces sp. 150FB]